jgi:hypothetical protein
MLQQSFSKPSRAAVKSLAVLTVVMAMLAVAPFAQAKSGYRNDHVDVEVLSPKSGDLAGALGRGFFIDLRVRFNSDLAATGASIRTAPPGPAGAANEFPGLVVLLSTTKAGAGPGQNLANLFNIIGVTDRDESLSKDTEIAATWVIAAAKFGDAGVFTRSHLVVAVVEGRAPDVVTDKNGDGVIDEKDLELMGFHIISDVVRRNFVVNGF